ncbi:helix-turn-helix domain-containing protein [Ruminococcaceae bacterium OttesenSCG-928-L11]|nr:helix-turn-helix domain-containing protein [Ruminococcaceae bacterium OttesenSCG-928-L11]
MYQQGHIYEVSQNSKGKGIYRCEHIPKLNNRYYILEPAKDNYGIIPKVVMLDNRLSIQSKAVYAYFCSFTGSTDIAFPRLKTILRNLDITEATFRKYREPLCEYGYIAVEPQWDENSRFGVNRYHLATTADIPEEFACGKPVENSCDSQNLQSGILVSDTVASDKAVRDKSGQYNNILDNIIISKQHQNQYHQPTADYSDEQEDDDEEMRHIFELLTDEAQAYYQLQKIQGNTKGKAEGCQFQAEANLVVQTLCAEVCNYRRKAPNQQTAVLDGQNL